MFFMIIDEGLLDFAEGECYAIIEFCTKWIPTNLLYYLQKATVVKAL